ncbi:MAG: zinc ABC transporter substrate-binding protein [Bacteroidota bacterium]
MIRRGLVFLIPVLILIAGCGTDPSKNADKPIVTVTILPFRYFVEQLSGDRFDVNVLVPPGTSHHAYDPTPRQLQDLEKSKALFINGYLGFEQTWLPKIRSNIPQLPVVDLSDGIDLITVEGSEGVPEHEAEHAGHSHEGPDPHYWLSVREIKKLAGTMSKGLIMADPQSKQQIEKNLAILLARLDSLDARINEALSGMDNRSFIIFHPALNYFARDYNLIQHSMELGGKEPTASHFRDLVDLAKNENISIIFVQKEYDQENARALAREIDAEIVSIDPMSADWMNEMSNLKDKLIRKNKQADEQAD